jgi:cytochrome c oxidase cbb3-type subunit III
MSSYKRSMRVFCVCRRLTIALCAVGWIAVCSAAAQDAVPVKSGAKGAQASNDEGRQLFDVTCAGCHGLDGRGGERGPDIATRAQVAQLSDAEIFQILQGGRPAAGMPPFESLGTAKLKELLAYVRSLQGKGVAEKLPGNPVEGKALFFGKARCSQCHMMDGEGGFIGRDLSTYGATLSPDEIRANIEHPPSGNDKANKLAVVTMRDSRKFSGVIRNEDNFSIQMQSLDGTFHLLNQADVGEEKFEAEPIMPGDYGSTLTPAQMNDVVSFLVEAARKERKSTPAKEDDEN